MAPDEGIPTAHQSAPALNKANAMLRHKDLGEALAAWDRERVKGVLEQTEAERNELIERFPLGEWPTLPLERYAIGHGDPSDTWCRWIEFATPNLGSIRGGNAKKLLIYKKRSEPGWYFDPVYADENEAWTAIRAAFVEAFGLASQGEFDKIDELQALRGGPALRVKSTWVYFPNDLLPISSKSHIDHFLKLLEEQPSAWSSVAANRVLLGALRSHSELEGWSTKELERFLYWWSDPRESTRVVKIAPGPQAQFWNDCRTGGYICVGWDDIGDLSRFADKEEFKAAFAGQFPYEGNKSQVTRKANELWTLMELEAGDVVIANRGTSEVCAIGRVAEEGYRWREEREEYRHTVGVDWDESLAGPIDPVPAWATVTVKSVPGELFRKINAALTGAPAATSQTVLVAPDRILLLLEGAFNRKSQAILYGPPGTGKTYSARRFATWWLAKRFGDPDAALLLSDPDRFAAFEAGYRAGGEGRRVWFMVANPQHWSWERMFEDGYVDYNYGRVKKHYASVRAGDLVVGYQASPDKRVVALARVLTDFVEDDNPDDSFLPLVPVARVAYGITWDELNADPVLSASEPVVQRCQGTLFALAEEEASRLLAVLADRDPSLDPDRLRRTSLSGFLTMVTFHPSYTYEDFVEGYKPTGEPGGLRLELRDGVFKQVCNTAAADRDGTYLLLIDEINRGNIPKIFGELVTLLERDKRGLVVRLPQSGEEFQVPPNVFVLGTMNTADRSIHLLDAALRRRFAFLELLPDAEVLAGATVGPLSLDVFLMELNRRVMARLGREKQIGHALLLDGGRSAKPLSTPEEFAQVFRHDLLPLLQEYVYDDYTELAAFLGTEVIDVDAQSPRAEVLDDPDTLAQVLAGEFGANPVP